MYVTHSAGFRHDSIPASIEAMRNVAAQSGKLDVTATEDLSMLSRDNLRAFDAVFFFTSGELPLTDNQKSDLLEFVRNGGGFGGAHSATDTLYSWPEYGELIGARFDGHPWVQEVRIDVEDPDHPTMRHLGSGFKVTEEIYQFREFSRERVRVLMTLDTSSVDVGAAGVHRTDDDFVLAWVRDYGAGRVFYTALGHFDGTWSNAEFQRTLLHALLWLTKQEDGSDAVRPSQTPAVLPENIGNAASLKPPAVIAPGSLISIFGTNLTPGSASQADYPVFRYKLAGSSVRVNGNFVPLLYASPSQINAYVPDDLAPIDALYRVDLAGGGKTGSFSVAAVRAAPGIFAVTREGKYLTLWATGLGESKLVASLPETVERPSVRIAGASVTVLFSGPAPGFPGLYQVNVKLPDFASPADGVLEIAGQQAPFRL